jgi:hypothetical protein
MNVGVGVVVERGLGRKVLGLEFGWVVHHFSAFYDLVARIAAGGRSHARNYCWRLRVW